MAEFKLGRIRFVWQGDWVSAKTYYKDDIVRHGGSTYLCVIGHVADADFDEDIQNIPTRWNLVSSGQEWKDNWQTTTVYKVGDIVKYGGYLYICNEGHTSAATAALGLEDNQEDWDLYAEGFDFRLDWVTNSRYRINDIVKYGGNNYICTEGHTSAATAALGLEADSDKWFVYTEGLDWKGAWAANTRYKLNDVVKYGGTTYICNTGHTSGSTEVIGLEVDQGKWDYMHEGTDYKGDWDNDSVRYKINDVVKYGGGVWICTDFHTSSSAVTFEEEEVDGRWARYVEGLEFDDNWDSETIYQPGDVVRYGGYIYVSKTNHSNKVPPEESTDWDLFNTGFKLVGDWDAVTTYKVGDVVRLNGYTYVAQQGSTAQKPPNLIYWERLNSGIRWQGAWANETDYVLGDVVRFTPSGGDPSSYICILAHTSSTGSNRPDVDSGTVWNLLVAGAEDTNLTTQGDLLTHNGSGPTRLPIGADGMVLVSNGTVPAWSYWGVVSNLFYVADHGVDSPAPTYGLTVDKPWKTVRYACEQVERGTEFPSAAELIKMNRTYIQDEVLLWVDAQITAGEGIWSGFVNVNEALCQRDIGLIIDALVHDLSHKGNVKTLEATRTYFNVNGTALIPAISDEEEQLVEALNFAVTVIEDILSSTPNSTYTTIVPVTSPAAEDGAEEIISELMSVITNALTAGNLSNLPATNQPTYTISVKTGEFAEVLPIIVPAFTAIVGDELRSTRIVPQVSTIPTEDRAKTIEALTYLRSITEDVITNTAVTSPYGSVLQNTSLNAGSVGYASNVSTLSALMDEISDILENGTGAADAFTFGTPTNWGTSLTDLAYSSNSNPSGATTGFDHARSQLDANRDFIIAEITAWIAEQVANETAPFASDFVYNEEACARDVSFILDALKYDLTYGGNTQTTVVARAYFSFGEETYGTGEKEETLAAYAHLKSVVSDVILENAITKSTGNIEDQDTSGTAGSAASAEFAGDRVQEIYDTIDQNGVLANEKLPATDWVVALAPERKIGRDRFIAIKSDLQSDATSWVRFNFPTLAFNMSTCSRDVGYILDAVGYDLMFGSNFASIKAALSYYRGTASAQLVLSEQKAATLGMLTFLKIKVTKFVAAGTAVVADILWSYILGYLSNPASRPPVMGTNKPETDLEILNGVRVLLANKDFFAEEAVEYIKDQYGVYSFNEELCKRDVRSFIEAIAYDIIYNGNYKVILATRYYNNAAQGSKLEDMFYVRNAGGLRNMTVDGLDGSSDGTTTGLQSPLTESNNNGTRRTNAGAYVSLDPGWGPNDTRVWTTTRSTYVQNITTFGIGAIGQKIDGAIHSGGNRSIVSNDFTQVISDGIGAWVTNNGLAELVSVFSYYAHIGYLAENGGKIRATNGNNSYGDYGSVSEGVDVTEIPILGSIDNRATEADIRNIYTDSNRILRFEYRNAGIGYSQADYSVSGTGAQINTVGNEIRDKGVFNVRLTDPGDSSGPGGANYLTASNLAQTGDGTTITLAATDIQGNSAYNGMSIYIIAGTGAGQYGYIGTYNGGSKVATVFKESTGEAGWDHVIPGTPIALALDVTSSYSISPRLVFSEPPRSVGQTGVQPIGDWKDVVYGDAAGSYTGVASTVIEGSGVAATFDVTRRDGSYTVTLNSPGVNYALRDVLRISGAALGGTTPENDIIVTVTNIAGVTGAGPLVDFTYSGAAIPGQFVAIAYNSDIAMSSIDGINWIEREMPSSEDWTSVTYGKISNNGYWIAVSENGNVAAYSTNGTTWQVTGELPATANWTSVTYGNGRFVAVSEGTNAAFSTNGTTWTAMSSFSNATWSDVTYGAGRFVAIATGSDSFAFSTNGTSWTSGSMPTSAGWSSVTFGDNRFIAVSKGIESDREDSNIAAYSLNGATWTQVTLPASQAWSSINYSQGVFYTVSPSGVSLRTTDGILWDDIDVTVGTVTITSTEKDIIGTFETPAGTVGNSTTIFTDVLHDGSKFIAVGNNTVDTGRIITSNDGTVWTEQSVPLTSGWEFVTTAYNGVDRYITLIFASRNLLSSTNGITWTEQNSNGVNNLPAARTWTDLVYGDKWVAIANVGANPVAYSTNGTTWTLGTLSTAAWSSIAYGDIGGSGLYVTIASGSQSSAYSLDGQTWTSGSTMPSSDAWSSITYANGTFVAVAGDTGTATSKAAYSTNGTSWTAATLPGADANWVKVVYGGGTFMAFAYNSNRTAISLDGITWEEGPAIASGNWTTAVYGSNGNVDDGKFVALRSENTAGVAVIDYILDTNFITATSTASLSIGSIVDFSEGTIGGLGDGVPYFVKSIPSSTTFTVSSTLNGTTQVLTTDSGSVTGDVFRYFSATAAGNPNGNNVWVALARGDGTGPGTAKSTNVYQGTRTMARSYVTDDKLAEIWITEPGSNYATPPTMTITDPNNIGVDATFEVRIGNGVLAQPTFNNRGIGYTAASATVTGDGFADRFQEGTIISVRGLSGTPIAGSNIQIAGIDDIYYRIVTVTNLTGNNPGPYTAILQVSPAIGNAESPEHLAGVIIRRRYSQVRLTGHDFLDIGTGNKTQTNYPGLPFQPPNAANETIDIEGGRVFYTSTDQDGNFRVGGLFNVEQATGIATLNADAFNIAGLQELQLGSVALGGSGAVITEFSTDPFFTADSDNIVPTQRAIKAYITSQIGGGQSEINVNTLTAGTVFISGNSITTTTGARININTKVNFLGGIDGSPVALNYFLR